MTDANAMPHARPWRLSADGSAIYSADDRIVLSARASAKCGRAGDYYECRPEAESRLHFPKPDADLIIEAVNGYDAALARIKTLETALEDLTTRIARASSMDHLGKVFDQGCLRRAAAALSTTDAQPRATTSGHQISPLEPKEDCPKCSGFGWVYLPPLSGKTRCDCMKPKAQSQPDPRDERIKELEAAAPDDIRAKGWSVVCHNDYRQGGETFAFWSFSKSDSYVKGEGRTDADALEQVRAAIGKGGAS